MYEVSAAINNVKNKQIPLTPDFQIDLQALKACWDAHDKILFICTPNNPSGNLLSTDSIMAILESFKGIVMIDEAYVDFSRQPGWLSKLDRFPNLIVLQTLSKAWGMAAIRVGIAMGNPYVLSMLDKIKPPYNLSLPNQRLASEAMDNLERKGTYVREILSGREELVRELGSLSSVKRITLSDANFLLVAFKDADALFEYLISEKVIVRNRTRQLHCADCLRITVGQPAENDRLITLIREFEKRN